MKWWYGPEGSAVSAILAAAKSPIRRPDEMDVTKKGSKTGRFGCHGETWWRNAHFCPTSAQGINALDADIETFEKLPELFAESLPDFI